jgi:colanic acid biosynthesis glycosyl transferase WcaI
MRILVLTINYWPEQTGIGAVLTHRCEYLASQGHEVTVCTAMPYYPEWRIYPGYIGKLFSSEKRNAVKILRSWLWVPKQLTSAKRVAFEISFLASSLVRAIQNRKPDLLVVASPPLGLGISAMLLSRWWKIPYVFDVQDLQPDAAADLQMLPGPVLPILYRLEALAYRNAALISTVTEGMRTKIFEKGVPEGKVVVVPPTADSSLFDVGTLIEGDEFRRLHNLHGKFVVGHCGNMGVKQGLDLVLDAAVLLKEQRDVIFLLAGDGAKKASLEQRAATLGLSNVVFLPLQDNCTFLQMLAAMDVGLIVQQSTVSDIVFPSKTVTLLATARSVIAAVNNDSEIARVIQRSRGGVIVDASGPQALALAVQELLTDPGKRYAMGEQGRQFALQHWEKNRVLSAFENHLLETTRSAEANAADEVPVSVSTE